MLRIVWRMAVLTMAFSLVPGASQAGEGVVRGTVLYEKIPFRNPTTGQAGLQLDKAKRMPVIGAVVELVEEKDKNVLGVTNTNAKGEYQLPYNVPAETQAYVRVWAKSENATVVDAFDDRTHYSLVSKKLTLVQGPIEQSLLAQDKNRIAGVFNILEAIRMANDLLRKAEPSIRFSPIAISWNTTNKPGTTSHFRPSAKRAYILGDRDIDSDEFDDYVLLHEYGHYLMHEFAKDHSPAGHHSRGDKLDPRVAWSEGWGNFFACAVLGDPNYTDTLGPQGQGGWSNSLEANREPLGFGRTMKGGYWSEHTVGSTLWDIVAPVQRGDDVHLGLGFEAVWNVLRGPWKDESPYANLIDCCDHIVKRKPEIAGVMGALMANRDIEYFPLKVPSLRNPYLRYLPSGTPQEGSIDSYTPTLTDRLADRKNLFDSAVVYSFVLAEKKKVVLKMDILDSATKERSDLDMYLINKRGYQIGYSNITNGVGGSEKIEMELAPGTYYLEVSSVFETQDHRRVLNRGKYRVVAEY